MKYRIGLANATGATQNSDTAQVHGTMQQKFRALIADHHRKGIPITHELQTACMIEAEKSSDCFRRLKSYFITGQEVVDPYNRKDLLNQREDIKKEHCRSDTKIRSELDMMQTNLVPIRTIATC
jgi:hypothetical protein